MKPRRLVLRAAALRDIARHEARLRNLRGPKFARTGRKPLSTGSNIGPPSARSSARPTRGTLITAPSGIVLQATILAEFTEDAMDVVRVRFAGEDWQR